MLTNRMLALAVDLRVGICDPFPSLMYTWLNGGMFICIFLSGEQCVQDGGDVLCVNIWLKMAND